MNYIFNIGRLDKRKLSLQNNRNDRDEVYLDRSSPILYVLGGKLNFFQKIDKKYLIFKLGTNFHAGILKETDVILFFCFSNKIHTFYKLINMKNNFFNQITIIQVCFSFHYKFYFFF